MAKTKISEFNANPALNTDIDSINISEGCAPSGINDAIRELMSQLKDWQSGTSNDPYVVGSSGSLTLNQGTANTVPYLNGSKVVTSGTALSFDGTNLGLGVTPSAWSGVKAFQIGAQGSLASNGNLMQMRSNAYFDGSADRYIATSTASDYYQNAGSHVWRIAASGTAGNAITFTQAMTLDADGDLGVGTTSPSVRVHAVGAGEDKAEIQVQNTSTASSSRALFRVKSASSTYGGGLMMSNATDPAYATSSLLLYNFDSQPLVFGTANTERARIDSSGNLLVGTTSVVGSSGAGNTHIVGSTNNNSYGVLAMRNSNSSAGKYWHIGPVNDNGFVVYNQNGNGVYITDGGSSWTSNSDERIKDIIEPISDAASKVSSLRAVIGKYKTDKENKRRPFLIAQDVQKVLPEAVNVQNDNQGTLGLQYTDVIPLLVAAIQELKAEFDAYKASHP